MEKVNDKRWKIKNILRKYGENLQIKMHSWLRLHVIFKCGYKLVQVAGCSFRGAIKGNGKTFLGFENVPFCRLEFKI